METFDFIPNNYERRTPDMEVVALFMRAFYNKKEFHIGTMSKDLLTEDAKFISSYSYDRGWEKVTSKFVDLKPVDYFKAFEIFKMKGYHIRKCCPQGSDSNIFYLLETERKEALAYGNRYI